MDTCKNTPVHGRDKVSALKLHCRRYTDKVKILKCMFPFFLPLPVRDGSNCISIWPWSTEEIKSTHIMKITSQFSCYHIHLPKRLKNLRQNGHISVRVSWLPARIRFQPSSSILKAQMQKVWMWLRFSLEQIQLTCIYLPTTVKGTHPLLHSFSGLYCSLLLIH